ncbi:MULTISPECIES: GntR family transcriptional regulator [Eubacterium]|uniref:DNA-binding transcriptional regulator YhcF, GntR family n=1 Tax=Eubacterium uniforme TaxID=39495 RepID=A0A1T4VGM9_9FIRM|nr:MULTISPECIES: GntR family transcriptional regulator [Eubacterium]MCR5628494.1 GntR family transcriptional regulator [Eubacterium sp.]SKA64120.1 DNA-binding transcriptional regulator YhcF, GntR family [Eubacterium uniforme]
MIIRIDDYSDVPIYQQIRNEIINGISSGKLKPGEQLPTVRALALEIGINSMTVSKAYQLLKQEGYILTDRKKGAVIREMIKQDGKINSANKNELKRIISESKLAGVSEKDFIEEVKLLYKEG